MEPGLQVRQEKPSKFRPPALILRSQTLSQIPTARFLRKIALQYPMVALGSGAVAGARATTVKLTPELLEKLTSSSGASLAITVDGDTHVRFMRKFAGGVCV